MKKYLASLKETQLFSGIKEEEIASMLNCLNASFKKFSKREYVVRQGESIRDLLLLAEGRLIIQREDYWGNLCILNEIRSGEIFGEAYLSPAGGAILHDVIAVEDSTVLIFGIEKVLSICPSACPYHTRVVKRLFDTICEKNRRLVQKLGYLSQRTTREKLLSYLSDEAKKHNSNSFTISFHRQQLADFLSVDRSAMSNVLCKMRDEGLLDFHKNEFTLF